MFLEEKWADFGTMTAPFLLEIAHYSSQKEACQNPKSALSLSNTKI